MFVNPALGVLASLLFGDSREILRRDAEFIGIILHGMLFAMLFDNEIKTLHDRVELKEIKDMTEEDYCVGGCTALIDAIGTSIEKIDGIHRYIRAEDVPEHTMFVIITDGMENASRRFSSREVKKMIEKHKKSGWEFLFIGANIDSVETARHFGISEDRAVNYHADKQGTAVAYECVSRAVGAVRKCAPLAKSWSEDIDNDYRSR